MKEEYVITIVVLSLMLSNFLSVFITVSLMNKNNVILKVYEINELTENMNDTAIFVKMKIKEIVFNDTYQRTWLVERASEDNIFGGDVLTPKDFAVLCYDYPSNTHRPELKVGDITQLFCCFYSSISSQAYEYRGINSTIRALTDNKVLWTYVDLWIS